MLASHRSDLIRDGDDRVESLLACYVEIVLNLLSC